MSQQFLLSTLLFVLAVPALAEEVDQTEPKFASVSVVGIESEAEWLKKHVAHVVIDKKRVDFPVVISSDGVRTGQLTLGAKVNDDGVVLLLIDGNEHPVVISPKTAMKVTTVFSVPVTPSEDSKSDVRIVQYIGVAAKGFDWDKSKSPNTKELLKIIEAKDDSPTE